MGFKGQTGGLRAIHWGAEASKGALSAIQRVSQGDPRASLSQMASQSALRDGQVGLRARQQGLRAREGGLKASKGALWASQGDLLT